MGKRFRAHGVLAVRPGPNFIGKVLSGMAEALGVRRVTTSAFHHQTNGCVERFNRTLARDLACFGSTGQDDWGNHVSLACCRYNSCTNAATGVSPVDVCNFSSFDPQLLTEISRGIFMREIYPVSRTMRTVLLSLRASLLCYSVLLCPLSNKTLMFSC